jgi:hypothetical protein
MKKLLFSVILTVLVTVSLFATGTDGTNARAVHLFETDFRQATNAHWTSTADYIKVSFTLESKEMAAFYDHEGSFIAVTNTIAIDELPVSAKRTLAKKFAGYIVKDAIRFEGSDEIAYFVSAENDSRSVFLKVTTYGMVSLFKETKK